MSKRTAPSAVAMNGGSPPTALNALAGLFTPPGITLQARVNASWLLGRVNSGFDFAGVVGVISGVPSRSVVRADPGRMDRRSGMRDAQGHAPLRHPDPAHASCPTPADPPRHLRSQPS